jgi:hypothetical protein
VQTDREVLTRRRLRDIDDVLDSLTKTDLPVGDDWPYPCLFFTRSMLYLIGKRRPREFRSFEVEVPSLVHVETQIPLWCGLGQNGRELQSSFPFYFSEFGRSPALTHPPRTCSKHTKQATGRNSKYIHRMQRPGVPRGLELQTAIYGTPARGLPSAALLITPPACTLRGPSCAL